MPRDSYVKNYPDPKDRHRALQQRSLARGYLVLRARNFAAHRGTAADVLGHVMIFDLAGNTQAGPFDLDRAERWIGGMR